MIHYIHSANYSLKFEYITIKNMQYATNVKLVAYRTLNIFIVIMSLWERLLDVLGAGFEYFLALALALVPSPWPWPCFFISPWPWPWP